MPLSRFFSAARTWALVGLVLSIGAQPAMAYIGPGAGFAAAGSVLVLLGTFLLAIGVVLLWPLKALVRLLTGRRKNKSKVKRVVVVGLDGLDPGLASQYMAEGRMPRFKALAESGCFSPLGTSCPSISPVAWSSYATGVDAAVQRAGAQREKAEEYEKLRGALDMATKALGKLGSK